MYITTAVPTDSGSVFFSVKKLGQYFLFGFVLSKCCLALGVDRRCLLRPAMRLAQ
jgi:hypothetical protein